MRAAAKRYTFNVRTLMGCEHKQRVAETKTSSKAVSRSAPDLNAPDKCGPSAYARMTAQQLLERSLEDPSAISAIVSARPTQAARIAQLAMQAGQGSHATLVLSEMGKHFLAMGGHGAEADLLFRGVLGLEGPGETMIKTAMAVTVGQRDHKANTDLPLDLRPGGPHSTDVKADQLHHAGKDPGWGRLYARFHDDPSAAATQLHDEALNDPTSFARHADQLSEMLRNSPSHGRAFVRAVNNLKGTGALAVKRWAVSELSEAMQPELHLIGRGVNDMKDGGPTVRVERLVPLLAELIAQPEMASDLVQISVEQVGTDLPPRMPSLENLFETVLRRAWSQATRKQVRTTITTGAAEMFRDSLLEAKEKDQIAKSSRTATFIGAAARAEEEVGVEVSVAAAVGSMLTGISDYLGPYDPAAKVVGAGLSAVGSVDYSDTWVRASVDAMMRQVYRQIKPRPKGPDDHPDVVAYNNEYGAWRQTPAAAYHRALTLGDRK